MEAIGDSCKQQNVTLQENNIVRNQEGVILGRMQKSVERTAIFEAVAQAWCTPENENKAADPILAEAIVRNIVNIM